MGAVQMLVSFSESSEGVEKEAEVIFNTSFVTGVAGLLSRTTTTAREIQFAVKVIV